ncbi:TRAP transporter large permease subunit, partial [Escherichia fergusonii]|uniref:TRAP transporter large permease subunit n=1 Tax=Escherichia fergusonii TaxID=564 RepID=UPI003EE05A5D
PRKSSSLFSPFHLTFYRPPVGVCLFVSQGIARVSLGEISRAVIPFITGNIILLFMVSYIPGLSLWLPALLGMK